MSFVCLVPALVFRAHRCLLFLSDVDRHVFFFSRLSQWGPNTAKKPQWRERSSKKHNTHMLGSDLNPSTLRPPSCELQGCGKAKWLFGHCLLYRIFLLPMEDGDLRLSLMRDQAAQRVLLQPSQREDPMMVDFLQGGLFDRLCRIA